MGDELVIRTTAYFCLAADHRAVDTEPAGPFLKQLGELLREQTSGAK